MTELAPGPERTANELGAIDPELEGIFRLGHHLLSKASEAGVSYALAVLIRALTNGVVGALIADPFTPRPRGEMTPPDEDYRASLGRILDRPVTDPLVDEWFELHGRANAGAHYPSDASIREQAGRDFARLADLLEGRLGPFFAARDQLDALLEAAEPTPDQVSAAIRLCTRSALRRRFFRALAHPGWLEPLARLGVFQRPPHRRQLEGRQWSPVPWPEGEYLRRIAPGSPDVVLDVLLAIPSDNDNPLVWSAVAGIGCILPASMALRLVPLIIEGIKATPLLLDVERYIELLDIVAPIDGGAAVRMLEAMLWIPRAERSYEPEVRTVLVGGEEIPIDVSAFATPPWVFTRVTQWDCAEVLDQVTTSLLAHEPRGLVTLLLKKSVAAAREVRGKSRETLPGASRSWYSDFEDEPSDRDPRQLLVHALKRAAVALATGSADDAAWTDGTLAGCPYDFARRLRAYILARLEGDTLRHAVDEVLSAEAIITESSMPEVGDLLRRRLFDASAAVRARIAADIERGPGDERLRWFVNHAKEWGEDTTTAAQLTRWQQRQLAQLPEPLPAEFLALAERFAFDRAEWAAPPDTNTFEEVYSDPIGRQERALSPISLDEMATRRPADIARLIIAFDPDADVADPSWRGLEAILGELGATSPPQAIAVLEALVELTTEARGIRALLFGIIPSTTLTGAELDRLGAVLGKVVRNVPRWSPDTRRDVMSAVESVSERVFSADARVGIRHIREAAATALQDDALWVYVAPAATPADAMSLREREATAILTDLAFRASYHELRLVVQGATMDEPSRSEASAPLLAFIRAMVEGIMARPLEHRRAAMVIVGVWLWLILWTDRTWLARHEDEVRVSVEQPLACPLWLGYVLRGRPSTLAFDAQRPWLLRSAELWTQAEDDGGWQPHRNLALWVILFASLGLVSPGDEDRLLETTLRAATSADRAHACWNLWRRGRDRTGAGEDASDEQPHVAGLWGWYNDFLAGMPPSDGRDNEFGALVLWVDLLPDLPEQAMALLLVALKLGADASSLHIMWRWLGNHAAAMPREALSVVRAGVAAELRSAFPGPSVTEIGPAIRALVRCGLTEVEADVSRLLAQLVEGEFPGFEALHRELSTSEA